MDQEKKYWEEVAEKAASIQEDYPLVVSLNTRNGGRAGSISEVDRHTAAKLVVDGTHVLASEEQALEYRAAQAKRIEDSKREAAARRLQVEVIERNLSGLSTMTAPPAVSTPEAKPKKQ
jgi:hypothetical protein